MWARVFSVNAAVKGADVVFSCSPWCLVEGNIEPAFLLSGGWPNVEVTGRVVGVRCPAGAVHFWLIDPTRPSIRKFNTMKTLANLMRELSFF